MDQEHVLQRMLRAAEAWGRRRWGKPVVVQSCGEPCCEADGSFTCEVELQVAPQGGLPRAQSARCVVTLEPDGSLGCYSKDEVS